MNSKKFISIFLVAVSAISMSSACCHAFDEPSQPELVKLNMGFSADDKCKSEDGKDNCNDKNDKDKEKDENKDDE